MIGSESESFQGKLLDHVSHISIEKEEMKAVNATAKKWLHRFGTFLIMGGWILVAFFLLGMVILYYHFFPYTK